MLLLLKLCLVFVYSSVFSHNFFFALPLFHIHCIIFFYGHGWPNMQVLDRLRAHHNILFSQRFYFFTFITCTHTETHTLRHFYEIAFDEPTVNPFGWRVCRTSFSLVTDNTSPSPTVCYIFCHLTNEHLWCFNFIFLLWGFSVGAAFSHFVM